MQRLPGTAPSQLEDGGKNSIEQKRRGKLAAQEPNELQDALLPPVRQTLLLGAAEDFISRPTLRGVAKRPGMLRRYADWMMLLPRDQARELQADGRIVAQLAKRAPERKILLCRDHFSARTPQCERQSALAKEHSQIDACGPQTGLQAARNLKGVHGGHWRSKQDSGLRGLLQIQHGLSLGESATEPASSSSDKPDFGHSVDLSKDGLWRCVACSVHNEELYLTSPSL